MFAVLVCVLASLVVAGTSVAAPGSGGSVRPATPQPGDAGIFETWTGYQAGRFLEAVVSADLNGDGHADAAWARQDFFQNGMQVQLNLGDGTLGSSVSYPAQSQSNDIAVGDLDQDGDPDLVVISQGDNLANNVIDLYFNNGNGTFTRTTDLGGHGPTRLALADLDGDGDLDLALANFWGPGRRRKRAAQQRQRRLRAGDRVSDRFQAPRDHRGRPRRRR